eukprot:30105-Eustigmatos_ZCMA.PRE.1
MTRPSLVLSVRISRPCSGLPTSLRQKDGVRGGSSRTTRQQSTHAQLRACGVHLELCSPWRAPPWA